jgi:hypothetical protein
MRTLVIVLTMAVVTTAASLNAMAASARFSVSVGANLGLAEEEALRFANTDATQIDAAMREVGGVNTDNAFLLANADPAHLLEVLARLGRRIAERRGAGEDSELFFYFSGHGSERELHMAGKRVAIDDIERRLQGLGASFVVSVIDACRTSATSKGVRPMDAPPEISGRVNATGFVELRAAAQGEPAQESNELQGAVFTHYWSSGLRGAADADGDGVVTLDELYRFTHAATLARTATAVSVQRPTLASVLSVEGAIVVSSLRRTDARLSAGNSHARYLVFALPSRAPVGEMVDGQTLAVARGRYLAVRREENAVGVAEIDLSRGGEVRVTNVDFQSISPESLAARGAPEAVRRWRFSGGLLGGLIPNAADIANAGVVVEIDRAIEQWFIGLRGAYAFGPVTIGNGSGSENGFSGGLTGGYVFYDGAVEFSGRLFVGVDGGVESVAEKDNKTLKAIRISPSETTSFVGFASRSGFDLGIPLGNYWSTRLFVEAGPLLRPQRQSPSSAPELAVSPSLQAGLFLGRSF